MKRLLFLVVLILLISSVVAFAQETKDESSRFSIDAGGGLSVGFFPDNGDDSFAALENFITILSTLRAALYGQIRYDIVEDFVSVGANVGVYAITYGDDNDSVTILDFPVHALARFSLADIIAVEGFGGYYFSAFNNSSYSFSGPEVGGKVLLGGLYVSASQIFATSTYTRVEVGYELTDLFEF